MSSWRQIVSQDPCRSVGIPFSTCALPEKRLRIVLVFVLIIKQPYAYIVTLFPPGNLFEYM